MQKTNLFKQNYGFEKTMIFDESMLLEGVQYYSFANALDIPVSRYEILKAFSGEPMPDTNFHLQVYEQLNKEVFELGKNLDVNEFSTKIGRIIGKIQIAMDTTKNCTSFDAFINMMSVFYLRLDENPFDFDFDIHEEKREAFKRNKKKFLSIPQLAKTLSSLGLYSLNDIKDYSLLKMTLERQDRQIQEAKRFILEKDVSNA